MRIQHVDTAKGQCEAVVHPRKEVKGKRIGVKRNTMYRCRDCLDKFELLPMPIPSVWMSIRGNRPGIPKIGRTCVWLAPVRLKRPIEES